MAIEDTKVEDLGVAAGAISGRDLIRSPAFSRERHGTPFGKSRDFNSAGLEGILVVWA
jgi:hypothetical protein